jgi:AraC family ethanolamine operon transcriptional activator
MKKNEIFISQNFKNFEEMETSAKNWQYKTTYKLLPDAYIGTHHVILLPTMQLSYQEKHGGILHDIISPKGMMTVAVVEKNEGKACFGNTKLKEGMVVFFDDKKAYTMTNSGYIKVAIFSFSKQVYKELGKYLSKHRGEVIEDTDNTLQTMLDEILERFKNDPSVQENLSEQHQMEEQLITQLSHLLETQTPSLPKLTKGEKIALEIRDRIYKRINGKVTIGSLAEEYRVSEQTLQNAFKSLFGFTPNIFIRHLKLNHVCHALRKADPSIDTIVRISRKWGFTHMGHFSRYFTELFGENPSVTLGKGCSLPKKQTKTE